MMYTSIILHDTVLIRVHVIEYTYIYVYMIHVYNIIYTCIIYTCINLGAYELPKAARSVQPYCTSVNTKEILLKEF